MLFKVIGTFIVQAPGKLPYYKNVFVASDSPDKTVGLIQYMSDRLREALKLPARVEMVYVSCDILEFVDEEIVNDQETDPRPEADESSASALREAETVSGGSSGGMDTDVESRDDLGHEVEA